MLTCSDDDAAYAGILHVDVPFTELVGTIRPSIVARAATGLTVEAPAGPLIT